MAKLSSINKNNKRIKLSNKFYKKRFALKKLLWIKKYHSKKDLAHNKNYQNYQEIQQWLELEIDAKSLGDHMVFIEN